MSHISTATHALIDGVCFPNAYQRLYQRDDIEDIEPLYLTTRWASLAEYGPILVKLKNTNLVDEACKATSDSLYRSLSLLSTPASTLDLSHHLRHFITFKGVEGQSKLLRFADPLVARHWLSSYGSPLPAVLMGPMAAWWVANWAPNWAESYPLRWQAFLADSMPAADTIALSDELPPMGHAQHAALDAVTRWQLKERLTEYLAQHSAAQWERLPMEERGQWLDNRLNDASAWGATTERQLAIWLGLALQWGNHFMTAGEGLYAHWVSHSPNAIRLSRQEQLKALDTWSRTNATTLTTTDEEPHG
ncbi:DUF4123 domain-containing protein [Vreelandella olivaria]|uniref:DUF4123 domain-containing protein n=1 Tax=Vreelandella olivaria TaxID=390919 RepID=UPI00201EAC96|nr:DUF4123 domain-containing protein [Halomonas olivaria]